ncbi:tetratricopeptide repeat protein [Arenimonas fontis]|uniref:Tetratricopeptide repeat protein n=1 Tax=Arenimonas fontis TaxID=2608255 RepID=A0A5B2ZDQ6_9GAMM|nr:tetratricopeptide repeat protein [Arenimonas fontis]KAA2286159.1 tetratricopeptide repeat protein [Arenimonas fontis]
MGAFAASLAVLLLAMLALALAPLWRAQRGLSLGLAGVLAAGTVLVYALVGTPAALDPANLRQPETLDEAIAQLQRRLADEPGSVEGWVLLARAQMSQQRWAEGRDALARAHALAPDNPDLAVEYADALMRAAADGRFPAEAVTLLEQVVDEHPGHQRGLFYLGAQRLQAGQPAEAAALWERLLPLLRGDTAAALREQIALARDQAGLPPLPAQAPGTASGPAITVTVELDPGLADRLREGDVLFVFARTPDGVGLPVAVKRLPAAGFPLTLTLSDADGLMPAQKLSQQARVHLLARVSRSGDAAAAPGDLEAAPVELTVADGARATLRIATEVE